MRIWITFIIAGGYSLLLNSQIIRSADFEQVEYFKILSPAKFYEVDGFGQLQEDTIFIANNDVYFSYFYTDRIDGVNYVMCKVVSVDLASEVNPKSPKVIFASLSHSIRTPFSSEHVGKIVCILLSDFENLIVRNYHRRVPHFTGGALTLPFKLRGPQDEMFRAFTTDVSLGPFVGLKTRIIRSSEIYITIPLAIGVSLITMNEANTKIPSHVQDPRLLTNTINSGLSFGSGLVVQIDAYEIGAILGYDFATGAYGQYWIYDRKPWLSFSIGYSFLN